MAILEILTYPNKLLARPAKPVENIDDEVQKLIDDMAETMYDAPGVGLAATQIGIDKCIIVYDIAPRDEEPDLQVLINPKIVSMEGSQVSEDEGCLSVPEFKANVKRAFSVIVETLDRDGNSVIIEAEDLPAVVLQHEIDHLHGILFINYISSLKREMYKRSLKKAQK